MRNISDKTDGVGDTLPAGDFNALNSEWENAVESAGLTLDPAGGPNTDLDMLGKTMSSYANAGASYEDLGTANAYVISSIDSLRKVSKYYDNMLVSFKAANTNTGASTINVDSIGVKDIKLPDGNALATNQIIADKQILAVYKLSTDRFEIVNPSIPAPGTGGIMLGQTSIPPGYLQCNGNAVSRTIYGNLFSIIGTTYGVGDGSTTFNVPDITSTPSPPFNIIQI